MSEVKLVGSLSGEDTPALRLCFPHEKQAEAPWLVLTIAPRHRPTPSPVPLRLWSVRWVCNAGAALCGGYAAGNLWRAATIASHDAASPIVAVGWNVWTTGM